MDVLFVSLGGVWAYDLKMKSLAFAVIGIGNMGKIHAQNLFSHRVRNAHLAAICDNDPVALAWAKEHLPGVPAYSDYRAMIAKEKLDAVVVVTPHQSHVEIGNYCLSHALHTLVEKPLAVTAKEAEKIVLLHQESPNLVSGVAFNQRSNPVYKKAEELISQIGTIRSGRYEISDWYRPRFLLSDEPVAGHES